MTPEEEIAEIERLQEIAEIERLQERASRPRSEYPEDLDEGALAAARETVERNATFGYANNIKAATSAAGQKLRGESDFGPSYDRHLQYNQERTEAMKRQHHHIDNLIGVPTSVVTPFNKVLGVAGKAVTGGAAAISNKIAPHLAKYTAENLPWIKRAVEAGLGGATAGALEGGSHSKAKITDGKEGLNQFMGDMGDGAQIGAIVGPATHAAVNTAKHIPRALAGAAGIAAGMPTDHMAEYFRNPTAIRGAAESGRAAARNIQNLFPKLEEQISGREREAIGLLDKTEKYDGNYFVKELKEAVEAIHKAAQGSLSPTQAKLVKDLEKEIASFQGESAYKQARIGEVKRFKGDADDLADTVKHASRDSAAIADKVPRAKSFYENNVNKLESQFSEETGGALTPEMKNTLKYLRGRLKNFPDDMQGVNDPASWGSERDFPGRRAKLEVQDIQREANYQKNNQAGEISAPSDAHMQRYARMLNEDIKTQQPEYRQQMHEVQELTKELERIQDLYKGDSQMYRKLGTMIRGDSPFDEAAFDLLKKNGEPGIVERLKKAQNTFDPEHLKKRYTGSRAIRLSNELPKEHEGLKAKFKERVETDYPDYKEYASKTEKKRSAIENMKSEFSSDKDLSNGLQGSRLKREPYYNESMENLDKNFETNNLKDTNDALTRERLEHRPPEPGGFRGSDVWRERGKAAFKGKEIPGGEFAGEGAGFLLDKIGNKSTKVGIDTARVVSAPFRKVATHPKVKAYLQSLGKKLTTTPALTPAALEHMPEMLQDMPEALRLYLLDILNNKKEEK